MSTSIVCVGVNNNLIRDKLLLVFFFRPNNKIEISHENTKRKKTVLYKIYVEYSTRSFFEKNTTNKKKCPIGVIIRSDIGSWIVEA